MDSKRLPRQCNISVSSNKGNCIGHIFYEIDDAYKVAKIYVGSREMLVDVIDETRKCIKEIFTQYPSISIQFSLDIPQQYNAQSTESSNYMKLISEVSDFYKSLGFDEHQYIAWDEGREASINVILYELTAVNFKGVENKR